MTLSNGYYYYLEGTANCKGINLYRSPSMVDRAEPKVIWTAPGSGWNSQEVWAPAMYYVGGKWYVYYTAADTEHRHYIGALECSTQDPWTGS